MNAEFLMKLAFSPSSSVSVMLYCCYYTAWTLELEEIALLHSRATHTRLREKDEIMPQFLFIIHSRKAHSICKSLVLIKKICFFSFIHFNFYHPSQKCSSTAPMGYQIKLDFRDKFRMEPSEDCKFDYLEVSD